MLTLGILGMNKNIRTFMLFCDFYPKNYEVQCDELDTLASSNGLDAIGRLAINRIQNNLTDLNSKTYVYWHMEIIFRETKLFKKRQMINLID